MLKSSIERITAKIFADNKVILSFRLVKMNSFKNEESFESKLLNDGKKTNKQTHMKKAKQDFIR